MNFFNISSSELLGPLGALALCLVVCTALFAIMAGLMKDLKQATQDVKTTCREMCEAFKSEAKEWRSEAKECREQHTSLVHEMLEMKKRLLND